MVLGHAVVRRQSPIFRLYDIRGEIQQFGNNG